MDQINEYNVFQDHGKAQYDPKSRKLSNGPNGYQRIRVHLIFAVKHDGRHKTRLVAGGHVTPDPIESICSGIVSISTLRLVIFLAKLNNLEVCGADIGNAYLEAKTKEKLYIVAGPEFEELEGHILVIYKALYGLNSSGLRAVTLGRYDILAHVLSMSRFRLASTVGHIERMKRIYGYLSRTKHYALRFRTNEPNYMHLPDLEYEWTRIYGNVLEEIPKDAPEPLGKSVTTTTFLDANLLHDLITGRSVTAVLHFFNLTPANWYSKRQAPVENATYGSEFVAAKTATEQIVDIRQTLRYLGVPIKSKAYMFGDNKSVVTSSTVPHSLLSKRHNILSNHRLREAIASKIFVFHWCDSSQNKSDILSKHWEFSKGISHHQRPL